MPFPIRNLRLRRTLCAVAGAAMLAVSVPAVADACALDTSKGSQVFAKYGDLNYYTPAPNGIFSGGTSGWSLTGASLLSGGPGLVSGDGHSLTIQSGGTVISPSICIGITTPIMRFMVRQPGGGSLTMNTYVLWTDWSGAAHNTYIGWVSGTGTWAPTTALNVSSLPLWESGSTLTIRVELVPQSSGNWSVDDFFVDPYSRG